MIVRSRINANLGKIFEEFNLNLTSIKKDVQRNELQTIHKEDFFRSTLFDNDIYNNNLQTKKICAKLYKPFLFKIGV